MTGQLKTKAALDYEERTDAEENSEPYAVVTITASDGALSASVDVSIAVNRPNRAAGHAGAPDGRRCGFWRTRRAARDVDRAVERRTSNHGI